MEGLLDATTDCSTLVDLLRWRAAHQPGQTAYTFLVDGESEEASLAYAEIDLRARTIGALLQGMGAAGERVLLLYPPGLDYIAAFFGCLYAGAVAVPSYPPRLNRPDPRLSAIVLDSRATAALTTADTVSNLERRFVHTPELATLRWLATDDLVDDAAATWQDPGLDGTALAFLQYTSGSTATPKGVMVSHGNILYNEEMIRCGFGHTGESTVVGWLPIYHDMGLIGDVFQPLYIGARCILMSPVDFLQQPARWLNAISRYRARTSGGPNFAYDLCARKVTAEQREALDLSCWEVAFNGAEPVHHGTLERFAAAFEPCGFRREAFYPCYGLAEATLFVSGGLKPAHPILLSASPSALEHDQVEAAGEGEEGRVLVGCGRAWLEQEIAIVDPEPATRCPAGRIGEIWVHGPNVAQGYWNRPDLTEQAFGARLADTGEGPFLRTGDLGFLADGELFITGRIKDLIIIRGRNHYPQDIELTVEQSHEALEPGCGAAFSVDAETGAPSAPDAGERLVVVQEVKRTHRKADVDQVAQAVRRAVADEHELQVYAVVLVKPLSVPKTSSGKIQRHACRAGFLQGTLDEIGRSVLDAPPELAAEEGGERSFVSKALQAVSDPAARLSLVSLTLQESAARALRLPPSAVDTEQSLGALGLDSLMAIELKHDVEASLGVVLPLAELVQGPSITALAAQVLAALESPAAPPLASLPLPAGEAGKSPLSRGQQAMWFLQRLAPESTAYHIANAVRLGSDLDVPALRCAFQALVDRHPSLRTTFPAPRGEPFARVHEHAEVCFSVEDAAAWSEADLDGRLADEVHRPFDLENGPLLRVHLFERPAQGHVLLLVVHHIVADFWSLAVLVHELGALVTAGRQGGPATLPPLPVQVTDYARWQAGLLGGEEGDRLWAYWEQQLGGDLPALDLPTDRPRPAVQTYEGDVRTLELGAELAAGLKALGRARGATLYTILLAAFQVLLYRYTGQEDVAVGSPTAGRDRAELAGVVGYFVNPVVMRERVRADLPFVEFLDRVRQTVLAAFAHQAYPLDLLVERLQPRRDLSRSPLFQVMFTLQQEPPVIDRGRLAPFALGVAGARADFGDLALESVPLSKRAAQFDLALVMAETAQGLGCALEYNSGLFDGETIDRMLANWRVLLEGIVACPARRIADAPLLTAGEQAQVLAGWNETQAEVERDLCVHHLFEAQAQRAPGATAAVFEGAKITYGELERQANRLAAYLQRLGVRRGDLVGICVERSAEMVVGLLGILKAGAAYVPLDPAYPLDRLAYVLEDSAAAVLLTEERLVEGLSASRPSNRELAIVCLDAVREDVARESDAAPGVAVTPQDLAYAIYTSGSTGRPKGVQVLHGAVVNFLRSMQRAPGLTDRDVLLAVTTLSFDIAGLELFLPLSVGGCVVVASQAVASDGVQLAAQLADCRATVMQATPSTWRLLIESGWEGDAGLTALCGGEAFPRDLANRLVGMVGSVWNMYGPTETTIWSAVYRVEAGDGPVPIGRPIANTQVYLLDRRFAPVPAGVVGGLYIGGDGLARGYLGRPALTAERFVPDPFGEAGARMYWTGDVARHRRDGNVEFLGRVDHQVKIRGFRIETGEVEAVLNRHTGVQEAVVVAREDTPGGQRLVAYVVPAREPSPTVSELRRFLGETLPDYMVPGVLVTMEALPLTPNGKVDRRALPVPEGGRPELETAYSPPRSELEHTIARIWQDVLQVDEAGIHDNFFDLGGHSLLMARVHGRLLDEGLGRELTIVEMFQYPTIHSLAQYVSRAPGEDAAARVSQERVGIRDTRRSLVAEQRQRRRAERTKRA